MAGEGREAGRFAARGRASGAAQRSCAGQRQWRHFEFSLDTDFEPPPIRLIAPLDRRRRRGALAIATLGDTAHAMPSSETAPVRAWHVSTRVRPPYPTPHCVRRNHHAVLRKRRRPHSLRRGRLRLPVAGHPRWRTELHDRWSGDPEPPVQPVRRVQGRVPRDLCGSAQRQGWRVHPVRSRPTGRGTPIPTISSD